MKIVIVVSSFGYGHITRQIALKDALLELKSDLEILFVISEKQYENFHSEILTSDQVSYALIPLTPTIVMEDNYSVDIESTKEIFSRFWEWETQIRNDRAWDEILYGSQLVISDIESVHHPIVKKMDIPIINRIPAIATDRPDITESAQITPVGWFQYEGGYQFSHAEESLPGGSITDRHQFEEVLRFG
ncbi:hypothetical protein EB169_06630, partial [archaeon]|nr:hypothetical protein [archaeon]